MFGKSANEFLTRYTADQEFQILTENGIEKTGMFNPTEAQYNNFELGQNQARSLDDPNISSNLKPTTEFENWITQYGTASGSAFDLKANIPGELSNDISATATGIAGYVDQHGWNTVPQLATTVWNGAVGSVKTTYENWQTSGLHALVPDSQSTGSNVDNAYFANLVGDQKSFDDSMAGNALDATAGLSAGTGASPLLIARNGLPNQDINTIELNTQNAAIKNSPEYNVLNNPAPDTTYKLDNGTIFKTNSGGYVEEITFTPIDLKLPRDSRQTAVGKEGLEKDVGGHIQACSMGGTCDRFNLFPQNANFNNSGYKKFENELRDALKNGDDVGSVTVKFQRSNPNSARPDALRIEYTINGETRTRRFINQHGGGE